MSDLKKRLDAEVAKRNTPTELTQENPDPLMVAKEQGNEYAALVCALFAYGNAQQIVKFLHSLDFSLLDKEEEAIRNGLKGRYYRFQKEEDVAALFIALSRLKKKGSLEELFGQGYRKSSDLIDGIGSLIEKIQAVHLYRSRGYDFLIGKAGQKGPYKRWLMFLRWMVRKDHLDMGLWHSIEKKELLLPLDTHTFRVGRKLGLLKRKSYDLKAVREITQNLRAFDPDDPVKYDFALYRLGQTLTL